MFTQSLTTSKGEICRWLNTRTVDLETRKIMLTIRSSRFIRVHIFHFTWGRRTSLIILKSSLYKGFLGSLFAKIYKSMLEKFPSLFQSCINAAYFFFKYQVKKNTSFQTFMKLKLACTTLTFRLLNFELDGYQKSLLFR